MKKSLKLIITIVIVWFVLILYFKSIKLNKNFDEYNESLIKLSENFSNTYTSNNNNNNNNNNNVSNVFFPECKINGPQAKNCLLVSNDVYDKDTNELLLKANNKNNNKGMGNLFLQAQEMPQTCGFGKLIYDQKHQTWECKCNAPEYFGGDHCDEPQYKMTRINLCSKVAQSTNLKNYDIATFNPFLEGVCTECSIPSAVPIIDSTPPKCVEINVNQKQLEETNKLYINSKNPCFYDALNPHHNNSPLNKYIQDYGCSCDYHNGFVEATVEGYNNGRRHANGNQIFPNKKEVSHACIKIGKLTGDQYHRTDIAFYTLKNLRKPIQVHTFTELESPFDTIFKNNEELLVNQPAISLCDKNDWLNRNIKPSDREVIRRLNYPSNSWPIVNKHIGRNIYKRRLETHPVPAYKLAAGRGFETKHWYEITNNRWLSNAIWGHPIVYPYYLQADNIWKGKVTLNPLGVIEKQYYGITLKTKPGEIVRLDTRGYKQENKNNKKTSHTTTLPPNHKTEMMNASQLISHPFYFYSTYNF